MSEIELRLDPKTAILDGNRRLLHYMIGDVLPTGDVRWCYRFCVDLKTKTLKGTFFCEVPESVKQEISRRIQHFIHEWCSR